MTPVVPSGAPEASTHIESRIFTKPVPLTFFKLLIHDLCRGAINFCRSQNDMKKILFSLAAIICTFLIFRQILSSQKPASGKQQILLPSSKVLLQPVPGEVQRTNSFPGAVAVSPEGRYIAILNNGWGTKESDYSESIAILDTQSSQSSSFTLHDFPDNRLKSSHRIHQTYFYGIAFSSDGGSIYASFGSITDPDG